MKAKSVVIGLFIALVVISLIGLGGYFSSGMFKRQMAVYTGYSTICVDGIKYIQFTSGASVKYDIQGNIERCK